MIVDAHQHFWQLDRGVNDWIDDSMAGIRRDFLPDHLSPYLNHLGIEKTILVQASETLSENDFMANLARTYPFVAGIVAWVDLSAPTAADTVQSLAQNPLIKGVRPVLQGIERSDWILQDTVLQNLSELPKLGLRFDALVQPRHLTVIDELVGLLPELAVVIDHAAKPVLRKGTALSSDWLDGMNRLAQHKNMHCKISGLICEHGPGWTVQALQPVVDHLVDAFSASRLMWGSDWPVLELDGSYSQWFGCLKQLLAKCSEAEKSDILGNTACRFYGL